MLKPTKNIKKIVSLLINFFKFNFIVNFIKLQKNKQFYFTN